MTVSKRLSAVEAALRRRMGGRPLVAYSDDGLTFVDRGTGDSYTRAQLDALSDAGRLVIAVIYVDATGGADGRA
jgi:hypothetical protein